MRVAGLSPTGGRAGLPSPPCSRLAVRTFSTSYFPPDVPERVVHCGTDDQADLAQTLVGLTSEHEVLAYDLMRSPHSTVTPGPGGKAGCSNYGSQR